MDTQPTKYVYLTRREWAIFLTCWIVYLFHLGPVPGVNENRYLNLARSIVDEGRLTIDRYHYNTVDKAYTDGHYYAGAAPGPAFLALPIYALFKMGMPKASRTFFGQYDVGTYIRQNLGGVNAPDEFIQRYPFAEFLIFHMISTALICGVLMALIVVLLYRLLGWIGVGERERLIVLAIYAFGTITFFYATRLYSHVPSTFFVFSAFVLLFAIRHRGLNGSWPIVAGLSLGMSALMEYASAPVLLVVGIYGLLVLKQPRRMIPFIIAAIIPVIGLAIYQAVCFGSPFATPYSFGTAPEDIGVHVVHTGGWGGFGLPTFASIWGVTFSLYRGIFAYMPVLIWAVFCGIRQSFDRTDAYRFEWKIILAIFGLQILFNSSMMQFWSGGFVWGPRYLIPVIPFLIIPMAYHFNKKWSSSIIIITGLFSILINWTGVQYILPQNALGAVPMFFLSGLTSQPYQFLELYFHTYANWNVQVSALGGWMILGLIIVFIWLIETRFFTIKTSSDGVEEGHSR